MVATTSAEGSISIKQVARVFPDNTGQLFHALGPVDLEIDTGEFVSLVGPSGCGKSTLLRAITGLDHPTSGDLFLDNEPITGPGHQRGLVFQDPTLFPWLTVSGNVASGLVARNTYKQQAADVQEYIRLVGLEGFESAYPHQLSGGMAQRVAIARALVNHPKVLLLDEPLGALDAFTRMQMQDELLRIWQDRRTTMVLVTHDIDEAIYMSDRIVIMTPSPGRIEKVIRVELGRPRQRNHPDFLALRARILEILHFAHEESLSYYL
ncbi:MAG TPA: ABC transporter ATP-binding protein [Armatimonadota bacterium]|nr:ABC transporter ATP-binding protein [Armatimonadota bacterium]